MPLNVPFSEAIVLTVKDWLGSHIPLWQEARIANSARHLGAYLGPNSSLTWSIIPQMEEQISHTRFFYGTSAGQRASLQLPRVAHIFVRF